MANPFLAGASRDTKRRGRYLDWLPQCLWLGNGHFGHTMFQAILRANFLWGQKGFRCSPIYLSYHHRSETLVSDQSPVKFQPSKCCGHGFRNHPQYLPFGLPPKKTKQNKFPWDLRPSAPPPLRPSAPPSGEATSTTGGGTSAGSASASWWRRAPRLGASLPLAAFAFCEGEVRQQDII